MIKSIINKAVETYNGSKRAVGSYIQNLDEWQKMRGKLAEEAKSLPDRLEEAKTVLDGIKSDTDLEKKYILNRVYIANRHLMNIMDTAEDACKYGVLSNENAKAIFEKATKLTTEINRCLYMIPFWSETFEEAPVTDNASKVIFGRLSERESTAEAIVYAWRDLNPDGERKACIADTNLSKSTISKFWRAYDAEYGKETKADADTQAEADSETADNKETDITEKE